MFSCSEVLSAKNLVDFIHENFVFWVGNIDTAMEERLRGFLEFPYMVVLSNISGNGVDVVEKFEASMLPEEVMNKLLQFMVSHEPNLSRMREQ